jgi:hypothetical protein
MEDISINCVNFFLVFKPVCIGGLFILFILVQAGYHVHFVLSYEIIDGHSQA